MVDTKEQMSLENYNKKVEDYLQLTVRVNSFDENLRKRVERVL